MTRLMLVFAAFLVFRITGTAANYYVDNTNAKASNSNAGTTPALPWLTIGKAAITLVPGDTVTVLAGAYDERVSPVRSGTSGNAIRYIAGTATRPKVRGFNLTNKQYIVVSGFELTSAGFSVDINPALVVSGTTGVRILNNYIHDVTTNNSAIRSVGTKSTNLHISGNKLVNIGARGNRRIGMELVGDGTLVENNDISHTEDFTRIMGQRNVVRNNNLHDSPADDAPRAHVDGMQSFCSRGIPNEAANYLLIEGNYHHDNIGRDEHFALINGTSACGGTTTVILRYNVIHNVGEGAYIADSNLSFGDNHKFYNNTTVNAPIGGHRTSITITLSGITTGSVINNIFVDAVTNATPRKVYTLRAGDSTSTGDYNLAYMTTGAVTWAHPIASEPHGILNRDPMFVGSTDFHLKNESPAREAGGPLTTVHAGDSGNGRILAVTDAHFFQDGWGGVSSDWIAVGNNHNVAQVSSINYSTNIVTLDRPIQRSAGQPVWLYKNSTGTTVLNRPAPDIGAFPFVTPVFGRGPGIWR